MTPFCVRELNESKWCHGMARTCHNKKHNLWNILDLDPNIPQDNLGARQGETNAVLGSADTCKPVYA
jgi:hypothetical protein